MKLVIASNNLNKRKEITRIMRHLNIQIIPAENTIFVDVLEDGNTFAANAQKKAEAFAHANQQPALADDSGLSVLALHGEPGVYSSRYAGEYASDQENYEKLLQALDGQHQRSAFFSCALHLAFPTKRNAAITTEAKVDGHILKKPQGKQGFGYDPIFFSTDLQKCFALCTPEEKASVSHRGRALRQLCQKIKN